MTLLSDYIIINDIFWNYGWLYSHSPPPPQGNLTALSPEVISWQAVIKIG
jgi:hypothetical protein